MIGSKLCMVSKKYWEWSKIIVKAELKLWYINLLKNIIKSKQYYKNKRENLEIRKGLNKSS